MMDKGAPYKIQIMLLIGLGLYTVLMVLSTCTKGTP